MSTFSVSQASYAQMGTFSNSPHPQKVHVTVEVNGENVAVAFDHGPVILA